MNGSTSSTGPDAAGVNGFEGATTGVVYGVAGFTASTSQGAAGVNGNEGATTGVVYGVSGGTNSATDGAAGMWANEGAATGQVFGLIAHAQSTSGIAVFGHATATSGSTVGVGGWSDSAAGVGGTFVNTSGSGLVLMGGSGGPSPTTIFTVDASGTGFFAGNLNVTGNLTKGSGSFKIDHPLDPENKFLSHSFVESPDMMNIYNGNVTTNKRGLATVTLPDYFEALNGDFRYQLTVIGQFAQAIVAKEIGDGRFTIKTNRPGVKVSWQVTGIRHDAYATAHRIPVAEEKPSAEQGRYLHPDVYGHGEDRQLGATRR